MDLVQWNWAACALHTAATIGTLIILKPEDRPKREVQMCRFAFDPTEVTASRVNLTVKMEKVGIIDVKPLLVTFFLITAVAHGLYATDFFGQGWYSSAIEGYGWNPFRWAEYSLSAGVMTYLISCVSGTKDQISAIASGLIVPSLMISGLTTERALNQNALSAWSIKGGRKAAIDPVVVWANILPSWLLFFTNWYIILSNYYYVSRQASRAGKPVDPTVSFMVYSQLFFFSLFGVIMSYQVYRWATCRRGRIEPRFVVYEKAYIVLSAITKFVLAATVLNAVK